MNNKPTPEQVEALRKQNLENIANNREQYLEKTGDEREGFLNEPELDLDDVDYSRELDKGKLAQRMELNILTIHN